MVRIITINYAIICAFASGRYAQDRSCALPDNDNLLQSGRGSRQSVSIRNIAEALVSACQRFSSRGALCCGSVLRVSLTVRRTALQNPDLALRIIRAGSDHAVPIDLPLVVSAAEIPAHFPLKVAKNCQQLFLAVVSLSNVDAPEHNYSYKKNKINKFKLMEIVDNNNASLESAIRFSQFFT